MANNLGTLTPSLVAQRTLDFLKEMFPPVLRLFINFTNQPVLYNGTITSRIPGATAAYSAVAGYAPPDVTDVDVPVVVNQFKAASVAFTSAQMSSTNRDLVNEHAAGLANSLGADLLDVLCALFVNANFANNTPEDAVNYDDATLRAIRKELNGRKAPNFGRVGIVNSDAFEALSGDSLVTTIDSNRNAHDDYQLAPMILRARGFEIIEYPQLPANAQGLNGFFMAPGALVGATGIPMDANMPGLWDSVPNVAAVTPVTDEDTGITLLQRLHKNKDGGIQMDVAWMFGFAKGNTACGELVQEVP